MTSRSLNWMALISAPLMLPALFLCVGGVLHSAFGLALANDLIGTILATATGRILLSPVVVLGGVAATLAINFWAACRVYLGFDTGTVYVTFHVARALRPLLLIALAMLLGGTLLLHGLDENLRIIAR